MKIFLIILMAAMPCFGVSKGIAGASFLKIDTLPRPSSLGGGFSAIADDVGSLYYNPAGLGRLNLPSAVASGGEWIGESNLGVIGYASSISENSGLGVSILYLKVDKMPLYKNIESQYPEGEFDASDMSIRVGYGIRLSRANYFGIVCGWINQKIEEEKSSSFFFDIGEVYRPWFLNKATFAIVLQNIGGKVKFIKEEDSLPSTLRLGFGYEITDSARISFDFVKPRDYNWKIQGGIEWELNNILTLRGGYNSQIFEDLGVGICLGAGLKILTFSFDYAYVPYNDLGKTHRLSFTTNFGRK